MSAELFVWDPSIGLLADAEDFSDQVCVLVEAEGFEQPTPIIQSFVDVLTKRYPDLASYPEGTRISVSDTIWSFGPLLHAARGGHIDLGLTMEGLVAGGDFVLTTALSLGLCLFDPQSDLIYTPERGEALPQPVRRSR